MTLKEKYMQITEEAEHLNQAYGLAVRNHWYQLASRLEPLLEDFAHRRDTIKAQIKEEESTRHTQPTLTLLTTLPKPVPVKLNVIEPYGEQSTVYQYNLTGKTTL
jgi:hypothetical protein